MSEWKEPTHEHLHSRRAANLRQNMTRENSAEVTLGEMKLYEALKSTVLKFVLDVSTVTVPKVFILQDEHLWHCSSNTRNSNTSSLFLHNGLLTFFF